MPWLWTIEKQSNKCPQEILSALRYAAPGAAEERQAGKAERFPIKTALSRCSCAPTGGEEISRSLTCESPRISPQPLCQGVGVCSGIDMAARIPTGPTLAVSEDPRWWPPVALQSSSGCKARERRGGRAGLWRNPSPPASPP
ncbi:hypothetical protein P4O66_011751 [Electrophorus voltai]|uniref:Uncharacterized protein n=1 Tax=Electrophorus voltai TaxID=2609070 RepID=A0AAD8Z8P5_9TELE|nr:hypothetical protein P4O66_011751 [Electrophorus voltai]